MSHQERRTSRRCPIDFFVQEVLEDRTYLHPAINLSIDGIYLLAHDDRKAIDGNSDLVLEFTLPTGESIRTGGRVMYVDDRRGQRGLGVSFKGMDAADKEAIRNYVEGSLDVGLERAAS